MIAVVRMRAADTRDAIFPPPSVGEGGPRVSEGQERGAPNYPGMSRCPSPACSAGTLPHPGRVCPTRALKCGFRASPISVGGRGSLRGLLSGLLIVAAFATTLPALAQPRGTPPARPQTAKPPEKEPPPPAEPAPAPYDRDLMRLAEIIGALSFLRGLCATPDAAEWPRRMSALMEAEGVTPGRRDRLAGAYNRGYRGYALTYRVCTPAATMAAGRFLAEGERLSQSLAGRFGG